MIKSKIDGNFIIISDEEKHISIYLNKFVESTLLMVHSDNRTVTIINPKIEDVKTAVNYVMNIGQ